MLRSKASVPDGAGAAVVAARAAARWRPALLPRHPPVPPPDPPIHRVPRERVAEGGGGEGFGGDGAVEEMGAVAGAVSRRRLELRISRSQ